MTKHVSMFEVFKNNLDWKKAYPFEVMDGTCLSSSRKLG